MTPEERAEQVILACVRRYTQEPGHTEGDGACPGCLAAALRAVERETWEKAAKYITSTPCPSDIQTRHVCVNDVHAKEFRRRAT